MAFLFFVYTLLKYTLHGNYILYTLRIVEANFKWKQAQLMVDYAFKQLKVHDGGLCIQTTQGTCMPVQVFCR